MSDTITRDVHVVGMTEACVKVAPVTASANVVAR
jgi:hypothetical protein